MSIRPPGDVGAVALARGEAVMVKGGARARRSLAAAARLQHSQRMDRLLPYADAAPALGAALAIVLLFLFISRAGERMIAAQRAREQQATPARASVVAIDQSGAQVRSGTVLMKIRLRHEASDGRELIGFWEVDLAHVPAVQPGAQMTVRIDKDNPGLCFPTIPGVQHSLAAERRDKRSN